MVLEVDPTRSDTKEACLMYVLYRMSYLLSCQGYRCPPFGRSFSFLSCLHQHGINWSVEPSPPPPHSKLQHPPSAVQRSPQSLLGHPSISAVRSSEQHTIPAYIDKSSAASTKRLAVFVEYVCLGNRQHRSMRCQFDY